MTTLRGTSEISQKHLTGTSLNLAIDSHKDNSCKLIKNSQIIFYFAPVDMFFL